MRPAGLLLAVTAMCAAQAVSQDNTLSDQEKAEGWLLLWDGKTYDGWMNSRRKPSERALPGDGTLAPLGCGAYMLIYEKMWGDFILSIDFKLTPEANSGIFVRTNPLTPRKDNEVWRHAIEVQIMDSDTATLYDCGSFFDLKAPSKNTLRPLGQWNRMIITSDRNIIKINLNGADINEIDLDEFTRPYDRPDGSKHKFSVAFRDHPREGYIGLQDHGDEVFYKNIKLKPLNE